MPLDDDKAGSLHIPVNVPSLAIISGSIKEGINVMIEIAGRSSFEAYKRHRLSLEHLRLFQSKLIGGLWLPPYCLWD